ncbi:MAG: DUF4266 domain-containing protein [Rhodoferax sp.]|nr:DUF4266 domain-containing protein [Rhodoferax sp.]
MTRWLISALGALVLAGCAGTPDVQAWEKGYLARSDMALEGNALEAKLADHIYFSKEAASGGAGVAGGGCGCN